VDGLIAKGDRVLVYGEPGSFKSWLLLDMAIAIASGTPWLGQFTVPVAKKVLYVDEEMNRRTVIRRIRRLGMGAGDGLQEIPLCILSHYGLRAEDGQSITTFLHELQESGFEPDVIILETMRQALEGSELDAQDVRAFWKYFDPLQQAHKTLIVSHHMRKPSANGVNDSRYRASGSTYILGGSDSAYAVTRLDKNTVAIECVRSRDVEEPGMFRVRVQEDGHDGPITMRFDGIMGGGASPASASERVGEQIVTCLRELGGKAATGMIKKRLQPNGVTDSQAEKGIKHLEKCGTLIHPQRGICQLREVAPDQAVRESADSSAYISSAVAAASYGPPAIETTGAAGLPDWTPPVLP